jgi:hypothetical protein
MKKIITILCLIALILGLVVYFFGLFPGIPYSEGHRSGVVFKFSRKGFVYKTWEGELSLGLTEQDSSGAIVSRVWEFSCNHPPTIEKLQKAEKSGNRVSLHYKEYFLRGSYYGRTPYNVLDVE